jgi:predicted translin family RNA/ssDNA-binding protein
MSYNFDTREEAIATITEETGSLAFHKETHTAVLVARTVKEYKEAVADYNFFDMAELNDNASTEELQHARATYLAELAILIQEIEKDIAEIATIIAENGWFM